MTKVIVFSAPSGSGKSTLVQHLIERGLNLHFSISATSRPPRGQEQNGVEYFFITPDEFRAHIEAGDFLEYEEVYTDRYYGTLTSQVESQLAAGENVICDIDVKGGVNVKQHYGERCLSVFIQPPSVEVLKARLEHRGTETPEAIQMRLDKAEYEMSFASQFDKIIINDDLETAKAEIYKVVSDFINEE
ncbi:MAG: guanylate kinase [Alloprevotella sp.]|nr:MAG: guanylate kinase [Alloprevotella sp.]